MPNQHPEPPEQHAVDRAPPAPDLDRYRPYLMLLAQSQVSEPGLRDRLDLSGIVQQTFLEAHEQFVHFRGVGSPTAPAELAGWLRRILANNLADAMRGLGRAKRDAGRVRSLEQDMEASSLRLGDCLAADQSSPSQEVQREERGVLLAAALAELPEAQRQAVLLRYFHARPLAEIAAHLGRTPGSVVGLLQRGLKALRERLQGQRTRGEL